MSTCQGTTKKKKKKEKHKQNSDFFFLFGHPEAMSSQAMSFQVTATVVTYVAVAATPIP